jgi:hypothetical protein
MRIAVPSYTKGVDQIRSVVSHHLDGWAAVGRR